MPNRVFVTVGENSGDLHASNLVRQLRALDSTIEVHAHGGEHLRAAGAIIHHDTVSRAAMGLRAALRAGEISRVLKWTRDFYENSPPDLHICVDSWSMNYHFAKIAREHRVPVLYYIAPQTWASREGRVKKMRQVIDRLACILPFEEQYFRDHGINATYVGHPLLDELHPHQNAHAARSVGTPKGSIHTPTIALLCGSRANIARANTPRIADTAKLIAREFPNAKFLVPTTSATDAIVREVLTPSPGLPRAISRGTPGECRPAVSKVEPGEGPQFEIQKDAFDSFVPQCDFALTVSGTAALHVAAYRVPLCIVYHGNPILWHLIGRWIIKARTYSLVNILSGKPAHIAREFIPWYGPTKPVADHVIHMLNTPQLLDQQRHDLDDMIKKIESPGASHRAAQIALDLLSTSRPQTAIPSRI